MIYGHSTDWGADVDLYSYAESTASTGMISSGSWTSLPETAIETAPLCGLSPSSYPSVLKKFGSSCCYRMDSPQPEATAVPQLKKICAASSRNTSARAFCCIAAANAGEDKSNIERIYGDSFLDITDLNQLPVKLTAVIKRFLR